MSLPRRNPEIPLNPTRHPPTARHNPSLAAVPCRLLLSLSPLPQPPSIHPPLILRLIVVLLSPPLGIAVPVAVAVAYTIAVAYTVVVPVLMVGNDPPYNDEDNKDDGTELFPRNCNG